MEGIGNKRVFARNLNRQIILADKTRYQVCKETGIKYSTMTGWLNCINYPRFCRIEKLADYFGIKVEDLLIDRHPATENLEDKMVIDMYMSLSDEDKEIVKNVIKRVYK